MGFKEQCRLTLACLVAILGTAALSQLLLPASSAFLMASMGASAVILLILPGSPVAQPWPLIGGHFFSALIGLLTSHYCQAPLLAISVAMGWSVLLMLGLRCLHPPGAATALAPIVSPPISHQPEMLLLAQLSLNLGMLLLMTLLIHRLWLRHPYPASQLAAKLPEHIRVSNQDLQQAISAVDYRVDISSAELAEILNRLQLRAFQLDSGNLSCGDIMSAATTTLFYDTDTASAWNLLQQSGLHSLPVVDRKQHLIGIVSRSDFFKQLNNGQPSFAERWRTFITPSQELHTPKPEVIGHLMTRQVCSLADTAPVSSAASLLLEHGYYLIPVTDARNRLLGWISWPNLLRLLMTRLR